MLYCKEKCHLIVMTEIEAFLAAGNNYKFPPSLGDPGHTVPWIEASLKLFLRLPINLPSGQINLFPSEPHTSEPHTKVSSAITIRMPVTH